MECVTSFEQLRAKLAEADEKRSISEAEHMASVSSWYLSSKVFGEPPDADPHSTEFKEFQLSIYERLTGHSYTLKNEETPFNFEHELRHPFPYGTQSADVVGTHLMSYGWLIKSMDLPPKSRVLEMGSGFGGLTSQIARMGYEVTCLDIDSTLLEFTEARVQQYAESIQTVCGDMATAEFDGSFDAIVFNASFHHSLDHRKTLQRMENFLSPTGVIAFTSEPIVRRNSTILPYPWGLRLDGLSIYCICKHGWMELGFEESYFIKMLNDLGLKLSRHNLGLTGHTDVWIAKKHEKEFISQKYSPEVNSSYSLDVKITELQNLVARYERGRFMRMMKKINQVQNYIKRK